MSKFNIVQFQAASGLPLTGDFIVNTLGITPDETVKRAIFWNRDKYGLILGRLQNHINGKGAVDPTALDGSRPKKVEAAGKADDDPFAETPAPADDDPFTETPAPADDDPFAENSGEGFF